MNDIKAGFDSAQDLLDFLIAKKFDYIHRFKIIYFKGMYYGVAFQSCNKEIVVMKYIVWYQDEGEMVVADSKNFMAHDIPYNITSEVARDIIDTIHKDMLNLDDSLSIYKVVKNKKDGSYKIRVYLGLKNCFYVLVGLYFYNVYYNSDNFDDMKMYFKHYLSYKKFLEIPGVQINPFRSHAIAVIDNKKYFLPIIFSAKYKPYYGVVVNTGILKSGIKEIDY